MPCRKACCWRRRRPSFGLAADAIEHGWRQQAISENAEAIRKLGTEIYDRAAPRGGNMMRLGKSLDSAVDQYNKTVGTLESRVLVSARKIGELGAHSDKEIESAAPWTSGRGSSR